MARTERLTALANTLAQRPAVQDNTVDTYPHMTRFLASLPPDEARKWQRPVEGAWMTMHPLEFKGIGADGRAQLSRTTTHWNEKLKIERHQRTLEFALTPGEVARSLRSYARRPERPMEQAVLQAFAALTAPAAPAAAAVPGHAPARAAGASPRAA